MAIWRVPTDAVFDVNEPYQDLESEFAARQVAAWDKCHEDQPIWDIQLNQMGNLITVGSDASIGLWKSPTP